VAGGRQRGGGSHSLNLADAVNLSLNDGFVTPENTTGTSVTVQDAKDSANVSLSDQLTLLPDDSPARTSVSLGSKPESTAKGQDYGQSAPVFLGKFDHDMPYLRTSQRCLVENQGNGFSKYYGTFPRSGMMRSGIAYQRPMLALPIGATEFGLLPTPQASDGPKWYRVRRSSAMRRVSDGRQEMLIHAVARLKGYPKWSVYIANPRFWELMMGYPIGHTDLED